MMYGNEIPPAVDWNKIKESTVPVAMYAAKHDLIVKPVDSHFARDLIGKNIVEYFEINGGHLSFMVGQDVTYFRENAMTQIKKYNPIK